MAASWLKKNPYDAVDIALAEGGEMVCEMCMMSGGCGTEDVVRRRTYHIHPSMSVASLCGKMVKEKNQNVSEVVQRQRKSSWQVKCVLH